jgi:hypothetical protein
VKRRSKKPLTFVRNRHYGKRLNPIREPLKQGTGGINPCFRPSADATKADLREFHKEDLKLRRSHQLARTPSIGHPRSTSIATGNRHGGEHLHKREIARSTASLDLSQGRP